ncbi:MAG: argininosuccinate lyase [bacterium]
MPDKPWGGRFRSNPDELLASFSESVSFDRRLAEYDIKGSMAHARMLGACGIIPESESERLVSGLAELLEEARSGSLELRADLEDIHMNVEHLLRARVGELAGKLHTGRSRNDQIALDTRLFFRDKTDDAICLLKELCKGLVTQAEANAGAVMPGFTHTRKAQPVLFSHHLLAYVEMFLRDADRFADCRKRINLCPLGAGALAGTTFPIDREMVARELGFDGVLENSLDAVSDRDYLVEFGSCASMVMVHLSRLMEELVWWGLPEIGFVELPESMCTGSSMMPNKKNPDSAELVRGKSGRVIGSLVSLLFIMKGTPLSYNRDFQEDKPGLFDAADTLLDCLAVSERLIAGMEVHPRRMRDACASGFLLATDVADYLATKGLPFRDAHQVAGNLVRHCEDEGRLLEELELSDLKNFSKLFEDDVKDWLSLEAALERRNVRGGTAPGRVSSRIQQLKEILNMK